MAKSKMAVRTKSKSRQRSLDLKLPGRVKVVFRSLCLIVLVVGLGCTARLVLVSWQQTWPVNHVRLTGDYRYLQQQDFEQIAQQELSKGLLAIDLQALQQQAKKNDWVDQVEVRKVWPDTLLFNVKEHLPVARFGGQLLTQKASLIKLDRNDESLQELPLIKLDNFSQLSHTELFSMWRKFKQMRREFELVELELTGLNIDQINNWILKFDGQIEINLGRKNRLKRVDRLMQIYAEIEHKNQIKKIDLRYHNGLAIEWSGKQESELKS